MRKFSVIIAALAVAALSSCATYGPKLETQKLDSPSGITGKFTVHYFGARYADDLASVVVLDIEGDAYSFDLLAIDSEYKTVMGVAAPDAVSSAGQFLSLVRSYSKLVYKRIVEPGGKTVGYEIKPVWKPRFLDEGVIFYPLYRMKGDDVVGVYFISTQRSSTMPVRQIGVP